MFCTKCGNALIDGANFCVKCGARIERATQSVPVAPAPMPQPQAPQATQAPQSPQTAPMPGVPFDFSRIPVRYRCQCGHVFDGTEQQPTCPKCGAPLQKGGFIQIYRMGNFMGAAVGMGIYVDDLPFGHLANQQSIRLSVPFGTHKLHMTHTTTRACNDPVYTLSPQYPNVWCKAHFAKAGFKINIDTVTPDTMPNV